VHIAGGVSREAAGRNSVTKRTGKVSRRMGRRKKRRGVSRSRNDFSSTTGTSRNSRGGGEEGSHARLSKRQRNARNSRSSYRVRGRAKARDSSAKETRAKARRKERRRQRGNNVSAMNEYRGYPCGERKREEDRSSRLGLVSQLAPAPTISSRVRAVPRINIESIDPSKFFDSYVSKRIPVVISGFPEGQEWQLHKWRGNQGLEYMKTRAGACSVDVEVRDESGNFGTGGPKRRMKFRDFLQCMEKGNSELYLTTQGEEGGSIVTPPANCFKGDFPHLPKLLGSLIPHRVNLWMGCNKHGSSSGLHHDFHDNLYLLIRGKKRFRLFSPLDTDKMPTYGTPLKVHWNGLIEYREDSLSSSINSNQPTSRRSDGADKQDVAQYKLQQATETLQRIQEMGGSADAIHEAELGVEECMERCLDFEAQNAKDKAFESGSDGSKGEERTSKCKGGEGAPQQKQHPPSFCSIEAREVEQLFQHGNLGSRGQEFPGLHLATPFCTEVRTGEMLYLPCGWFHEVTSFGENAETEQKEKCLTEESGVLEARGGDGEDKGVRGGKKESRGVEEAQSGRSHRLSSVHLALNYWMYPPGTQKYESPYEDGYWRDIGKERGTWK